MTFCLSVYKRHGEKKITQPFNSRLAPSAILYSKIKQQEESDEYIFTLSVCFTSQCSFLVCVCVTNISLGSVYHACTRTAPVHSQFCK